MKKRWRTLILLLAAFVGSSNVRGDKIKPPLSWERYPSIATSSVKLEKDWIDVFVFNNSKTRKLWIKLGRQAIDVFYSDGEGKEIPLQERRIYNDGRNDDDSKNPFPLKIEPGVEARTAFLVTPKEISLLKSHPIVLHFVMYDPADERQYNIESNAPIRGESR